MFNSREFIVNEEFENPLTETKIESTHCNCFCLPSFKCVLLLKYFIKTKYVTILIKILPYRWTRWIYFNYSWCQVQLLWKTQYKRLFSKIRFSYIHRKAFETYYLLELFSKLFIIIGTVSWKVNLPPYLNFLFDMD